MTDRSHRLPQASSDADLAVRLRAGELPALAELYDRHVRDVHDLLARFVRNGATAERLAHSTFVSVWERRTALRDPARVRAWVHATAYGLGLPYVIRSKPAGPAGTDGGDLLWAAASRLDPRQYAVLDLCLRRGLTAAELAVTLGVRREQAERVLQRSGEALGAATRLVLVNEQRDRCVRLAALVPAGVRALSVLQRSAVDQHVHRCEACRALGWLLASPRQLMGGLHPMPVPAALARDGADRLWRTLATRARQPRRRWGGWLAAAALAVLALPLIAGSAVYLAQPAGSVRFGPPAASAAPGAATPGRPVAPPAGLVSSRPARIGESAPAPAALTPVPARALAPRRTPSPTPTPVPVPTPTRSAPHPTPTPRAPA